MLAFRASTNPQREGLAEGATASVQAYLDLAHGVYQLGRIDEATDLMARAVTVAQGLDEDDPQRGRVFNKLGVLRARQGKHGEAERMLRRGVAVFERALPSQRSELSTALANLGSVYRSMERNAQARLVFERSLKLAESVEGEPDLPVAWTLDKIGELDAAEGNVPTAVYVLRRSLAIKERILGPADWEVGVTLERLADLYFKQERYNEAETYLLRVLMIRERVLGWDDPAMAKPLMHLAQLYAKQRKTGRAEQLVRYALKLFSEVLPPGHNEIITSVNLLAEIYHSLSRFADADAVWKLARDLMDGTDGSRSKLSRYAVGTPPRISGPGVPLLEPGEPAEPRYRTGPIFSGGQYTKTAFP